MINAETPIGEEDLKDPDCLNYFVPYAIEAIKHHNLQEGAKLELVRILKLNVQTICGSRFYFTLSLKDERRNKSLSSQS